MYICILFDFQASSTSLRFLPNVPHPPHPNATKLYECLPLTRVLRLCHCPGWGEVHLSHFLPQRRNNDLVVVML